MAAYTAFLSSVSRVVSDGLHPCYVSVEEYLYDLYPELPWEQTAMNAAIRALQAAPTAHVLAAFQARTGFDLAADLDRALTEC